MIIWKYGSIMQTPSFMALETETIPESLISENSDASRGGGCPKSFTLWSCCIVEFEWTIWELFATLKFGRCLGEVIDKIAWEVLLSRKLIAQHIQDDNVPITPKYPLILDWCLWRLNAQPYVFEPHWHISNISVARHFWLISRTRVRVSQLRSLFSS